MTNRIELDLPSVAAIIPAALVGALVGCLALGPLGFLAGGVLSGGAGALLAKRVGRGTADAAG